MKKFENLSEFIDRAVKNRKYPHNTAHGLKAALKIFESELNDEERNSLDKFRENLEQIYRSVSSNNKNITQGSLATYKSRVLKLLRDYEQYGVDPTKMANWTVKAVLRQKRSNPPSDTFVRKDEQESGLDTSTMFVFDFRGGIKLIIPRNQNTSNAIADGELKSVRSALTKFADDFMAETNNDKNIGSDL